MRGDATPGGYAVDALVTDFDDTLTARNTTPAIFELLYRHAEEPEAARARFAELSGSYFAEKREAIDGAEDVEGLCERLGGLERRYAPLIEPYFAGVTREELSSLGRAVEMRPGSGEVLRALRGAGVRVAVDSNSWCADLVRAAVDGSVPAGEVYANTLVYGPDGACTGEIAPDNLDPAAKRDALVRYREATGARRVAYVGDDINDLPAMAAADVAFALHPSAELSAALDRYGLSGHVAVVRSWDEVEERLRSGHA